MAYCRNVGSGHFYFYCCYVGLAFNSPEISSSNATRAYCRNVGSGHFYFYCCYVSLAFYSSNVPEVYSWNMRPSFDVPWRGCSSFLNLWLQNIW